MKKDATPLSLDLITLCDYALVSQENKLSIVGIFDQIFVPRFPWNHPKMFVVAVLKGGQNITYEVSIRMVDPSGKEILKTPGVKNSLGSNGRSNVMIGLENIKVDMPGEYLVEVSSFGIKLGEMKLNVFGTGGERNEKKGSIPN